MISNRKKYGFILIPLSWLYGLVIGFRHFLYNISLLRSKEYPIPIVCVGNITVGGTGKTPHVEYVVKVLKEHYTIAVLSRGYKRRTKGYLEVFTDSSALDVGDEPLQIKQKFPDITVVVCEKRRKAIDILLKKTEPKIDVIIMDDGYQHLAVKAGVYLLLVDYNNPIYEDYLLPYGNLRERVHHKSKAHIVIVTNTPPDIKPIEKRIIQKKLELFPFQYLFFSRIEYKSPVVVFPGKFRATKYSFTKCKYYVLLVTGIANPKPLIEYIKRFSVEIFTIIFPDHYYFKTKDIEQIISRFNEINQPNKVIITTEKDAIRLRESPMTEELQNLPLFYIPIEIEILYNEKNMFNQELIEYVRKNQPISSIHYRKNKF
ncbi:MAG: tetraacyldisaccharide 4'-kinase [Bacteroidales bacterium]|nr:tetraacyldisaccharide 4'-kinase [Bacteroidales bacterium]